jgi:hypothetical protein
MELNSWQVVSLTVPQAFKEVLILLKLGVRCSQRVLRDLLQEWKNKPSQLQLRKY